MLRRMLPTPAALQALQFCKTATRRRFSSPLRSRRRHSRGGDRLSIASAAAVSGGLLAAIVVGWEREVAEVRCEPGTEDKMATQLPLSFERRELRRVALAHLAKSASQDSRPHPREGDARTNYKRSSEEEEGEDRGGGGTVALAAALLRLDGEDVGGRENGDDEAPGKLPPNVYDVDRILAQTPLLRNDNAFHDTLNNDDAISCPFVLNRPGPEGEGIEAVVRFGKSIAGHPKIVHGGVTALTFDNLFGTALFLQNTGAVVTAYLKVDYKAPLPCLTTAVVDITVDRKEGRKLFVSGRLKSLDGAVTYSSAEALFIKPREERKKPGAAEGGRSNKLIQGLEV